MDKFDGVRVADIDESVIDQLRSWDVRYGVEVVDFDTRCCTIRFGRLPPDVMTFAEELRACCPEAARRGGGVEGLAERLELERVVELVFP